MRRILAQHQEEKSRAEVALPSAPVFARKIQEEKKEILEVAPTLPPPPVEVEDNALPVLPEVEPEVVTETKKEEEATSLDKAKKKKVK